MIPKNGAVVYVAEERLEVRAKAVQYRNKIFTLAGAKDLFDKAFDRLAIFVKQ